MRSSGAALLTSAALLALSAVLLPAPARAEVDGVDVDITKVPEEFEAGEDAELVEVVVSTDNEGRCQKVRWSMVVKVEGVDPDQVKVDRVEEDGSFPTQVRADGDGTRITDQQVDPGALCRGRTVTARYQVSVDDDAPSGEVTFGAEAFDVRAQLLERASASSTIVGEAPSPAPSSPAPEAEESEEPAESAAAIPPPADAGGISADRAAGQDSTPSLLLPGLIVGAVLVFLGVGLLLRIKLRNKPKHHPVAGYARY